LLLPQRKIFRTFTESKERLKAPVSNNSLGQDYEKTSFGGRLVSGDGLDERRWCRRCPPGKSPACINGGDPYKNYSCLDAYLGSSFMERLVNYYRLEWGHDAAPADPKAPPGRRAEWPETPVSIPPYPFTEWPYGGSTSLGVTRASSIDSPLMAALGEYVRGAGAQRLSHSNLRLDQCGRNLSSNTVRGGNAPAAYDYNPNTVQLDQAVIYFERLPDTVQKDHVDWGFRIAPIYGENYRYTTAYGLWSLSAPERKQELRIRHTDGLRRDIYSAGHGGLMLRFGLSFRFRTSRRSWRRTITCTPIR